MRFSGKTLVFSLLIGFGGLLLAIGYLSRFSGTPRRQLIETLANPLDVAGWKPDGLQLADGRLIPIPGIHQLPPESPALHELTKRGVEVDGAGRVFGLVGVWHWCGNDPVKNEIRRVEISEVLRFLQVGDADTPNVSDHVRTPGGSFSGSGWRIEEYWDFQIEQRMKEDKAGA